MRGKHKKKLRAEKSKVKLKQKKTLPKGQNITDTSFKVRKIVTVEQFKPLNENEPVSSWNVTLKDLLNRLSHYNQTSRLNGLTGIKELVTRYPNVLKGPMCRLTVSRILELLIDPEHKVRLTAMGLLEYLFTMLTPELIVPFHDIVVVHLSCAMTHRDVGVQQDSLKFVDILHTFVPEAIKKNFNSLIQNFIRIFKIYFYGSRSEMSMGKGTKFDLEKTRTRMFERFYQILTTVYSVSENNEEEAGEGVTVDSKTQRFNLGGLDNSFKEIPDLSSVFKKSKDDENVLKSLESVEFQTQTSIIVPLLFDTWAEFLPNKQTDGFTSEFALSENTGELLLVILKILLLFYEKIQELKDSELGNWFISTYSASFKKFFVTNFPYMPSISKKDLGPSSESSNLNVFMMQNLIICYLFYCFKLHSKQKNNDQDLKMERYIASVLLTKNPQGPDLISKILEAMLNTPKNKKSDTIVGAIVKTYTTTSNTELKRRLFQILMNITLEQKYSGYQGNQSLINWLKTLPEKLQKPRIYSYVIETILKIICRPVGASVLKEIESRAVEIIEDLPDVKIEGMDQFSGQKLIANILFWCNNKVLEEAIDKGILQKKSYPEELKSYIVDIYSYRLTGQSNCFFS